MGTLASELGALAERISEKPRVYVDANVAAGLVAFMRSRLGWDVLFVIEHDDLRRARDGEHYRLARQLRRTLITHDRDYLDDRRFPPAECGGVVVLAAPSERGFIDLLRRLDSDVFHASHRATPDRLAHAGEATSFEAGASLDAGASPPPETPPLETSLPDTPLLDVLLPDVAAQVVISAPDVAPLPLEGRKLHVHVDWAGIPAGDSLA